MTASTPDPRRWGITNDYGPLRDVLLGTPAFYRWIDAGPITMRTLQNQQYTGVEFNLQTAMSQHAEMVSIYEDNGVACHYLEADEVLHRNFFARDSSAMSPWGPLICHMQTKSRRADYVTAIRFYQDNDIPIWRYATAGHFEGGDFNILEPGFVLIGFSVERSERRGLGAGGGLGQRTGLGRGSCSHIPRVRAHGRAGGATCAEAARGLHGRDGRLAGGAASRARLRVRRCRLRGSEESRRQSRCPRKRPRIVDAGSQGLNERLRAMGFEVFDPDMSMFTLGGGGVHCLCQALCRDEA